MNSNIPDYDDGVLRINRKNLKQMPKKEDYSSIWNTIEHLIIPYNTITELNASDLPPNLTYLDVSYNPISKITGIFPESLEYLVLDNTLLQIVPSLPPKLINLNIDLNIPVINENTYDQIAFLEIRNIIFDHYNQDYFLYERLQNDKLCDL